MARRYNRRSLLVRPYTLTAHALNRLCHAHEKLSAAVYVLATNPHDVKARLRQAWEPLVLVNHRALPPHLARQYDGIVAALTQLPPPPHSKTVIGFTLHRMHFKTAARIAARIVQLEAELDVFIRAQTAPPPEARRARVTIGRMKAAARRPRGARR